MFGKILSRQLKKMNLSDDRLPSSKEEWLELLHQVNKQYEEFDAQRKLNENTINVAMTEMDRLNLLIQARAEEQIQQTQDNLNVVVDAVPSIIAWTNSEGVILGCNSNLAHLLKKPIEEIINFNLSELQLSKVDFLVQTFLQSHQENFSCEITLEPNNTTEYFKFYFKKFEDNQKMVFVGHNITEEVLKKQALEAAQAQAISSSRMALLGEMASGIAHEINNPLAVISTFAYQVNKRLNEQRYEGLVDYVKKIQTTVHRITKIISGLRTFARDGQHDPFLETPLKSIVEDTLELAQEKLSSLKIKIEVDHFDENLSLDCRSTQLSQVLLNLISNARDAISKNDHKWIKIQVKETEDKVFLSVIDSGQGIPLDIQEKIFRPFFTTKGVGAGTGLGLSISIGIIESHNGKMYIDNSSQNTRFVIELPKKQIISKDQHEESSLNIKNAA